ncbi:MAG: mechanosensitive ion channel protein [delta proteobacterium MLS_D]|jgi:small conductance mechanosensitive channel|nr:MAG: mechanosensitive ion channel protein [delta proteobacterium MLS_D]
MEQMTGTIQAWVALYGFRVIGAAAILIIGYFAAKAIRALIRRVLEKSNVDEMLISFTASVTYVAVLAFVIIAAVGKLGVQTASFIAVVGAAGLAIGLALQGSLANFAAGVLMVIFKPFKVGDYIEAAGTGGTVEDIGIFTTGLKSPDNKRIIVPNAKLTSDNITNYSAKDQRRVDLVASVSYRDDLDKVRKTLEEILTGDDRVLSDPAFTVAVLSLSDSSVDFAVRPWVKSGDYWGVLFDTQERIKKRFDAEGISIPFPQQDVHLHKAD